MMRRTFALILIASAALCGHARAALYEFTVTARVFWSIHPFPAIGDEVTVKYVANSTDIDPTMGLGRYAATSATVTCPGGTYTPVESDFTSLAVILGSGTGGDDVAYGTFVRIPSSPEFNRPLAMTISFPRGSFDDESLPLSLQPSDSRFTLLDVFPALNVHTPIFSSRVTSYSSVEVPEPEQGFVLTLVALTLHRLGYSKRNRCL